MENNNSGELLTPEQVAKWTGLTRGTLANLRVRGSGPAYFKVARFVRYDSNDVDAWLRSRRYTSTSQESAA